MAYSLNSSIAPVSISRTGVDSALSDDSLLVATGDRRDDRLRLSSVQSGTIISTQWTEDYSPRSHRSFHVSLMSLAYRVQGADEIG